MASFAFAVIPVPSPLANTQVQVHCKVGNTGAGQVAPWRFRNFESPNNEPVKVHAAIWLVARGTPSPLEILADRAHETRSTVLLRQIKVISNSK
jgi:hypothetical protein